MVRIEKLKSIFNKSCFTLCDLLYKDNNDGKNYLGLYPSTHLLEPYIKQQLTDVKIGELYGYEGIDINTVLTIKRDIIIETSYLDLYSLPKAKQKILLENYVVIINDLEEGGAVFGYMGPCIIEHIKSLNIIPRKIYALTSGFLQHDYPDLNIKSIYVPAWAAFCMLSNKITIETVFERSKKEAAINQILNKDKKFGLCLNKKPRIHRVELLAELEHRSLLHHMDWTLVYHNDTASLGKLHDFINSPSNFQYNDKIQATNNIKIHKFLSSYSFPRVLKNSKHATFGDTIGPADAWLGHYNYYISTETYVDLFKTSLGTTGFVTEKTFKSFSIGAYPFVLGIPNIEKQLRNMGFALEENKYDLLSGKERVEGLCNAVNNALENPKNISEYVVHNFNLISNSSFLASIFSSAINKIADIEVSYLSS